MTTKPRPSISLSDRLKRLSEHQRAVYFGNRRAGAPVLLAYARALRAEREDQAHKPEE